jgi:acyl carrier protein
MYAMVNLSNEAALSAPDLSETERIIATLWREVLDKKELAQPTDNFFDLGGSSIDMVMILFRIYEEFSVELPDNAVFDAPSLRELAALVDAACSA